MFIDAFEGVGPFLAFFLGHEFPDDELGVRQVVHHFLADYEVAD